MFEDRYADFEAPSPSMFIRKPLLSERTTTQNDKDRRQLPPPPRPTTIRPRQHFRPPPPQRKSVVFNQDEYESDGESDLFNDAPHEGIDFSKMIPIRPRRPNYARRQAIDPEYLEEGYLIEPAGPKIRRANRRSVSYTIEDRINDAEDYQHAVADAASAGSRSTRSIASRDESSFRQSETTKTTRSNSNDEDITVKVRHGAVVEYNGIKIKGAKKGKMTLGGGDKGIDRGIAAPKFPQKLVSLKTLRDTDHAMHSISALNTISRDNTSGNDQKRLACMQLLGSKHQRGCKIV